MTCDDCDRVLVIASDESAMAMDIDMGGTGLGEIEYACRCCGRNVCDTCAVVDVGEGRECLQCKTSQKRWIGGIGWMHQSLL